MVGWDSYSVGYHGDDGSIYFEGDDPVEETGKSMKTGDVVGVVFDAQQVCSMHLHTKQKAQCRGRAWVLGIASDFGLSKGQFWYAAAKAGAPNWHNLLI